MHCLVWKWITKWHVISRCSIYRIVRGVEKSISPKRTDWIPTGHSELRGWKFHLHPCGFQDLKGSSVLGVLLRLLYLVIWEYCIWKSDSNTKRPDRAAKHFYWHVFWSSWVIGVAYLNIYSITAALRQELFDSRKGDSKELAHCQQQGLEFLALCCIRLFWSFFCRPKRVKMDPKTESKQPKRWMTLQVGPQGWQVWHRVLLIQFEEPSWQPVDVATCGKLICPTKVPTSVESNYSHAPSQRVHMYYQRGKNKGWGATLLQTSKSRWESMVVIGSHSTLRVWVRFASFRVMSFLAP